MRARARQKILQAAEASILMYRMAAVHQSDYYIDLIKNAVKNGFLIRGKLRLRTGLFYP